MIKRLQRKALIVECEYQILGNIHSDSTYEYFKTLTYPCKAAYAYQNKNKYI